MLGSEGAYLNIPVGPEPNSLFFLAVLPVIAIPTTYLAITTATVHTITPIHRSVELIDWALIDG